MKFTVTMRGELPDGVDDPLMAVWSLLGDALGKDDELESLHLSSIEISLLDQS